MTEQKEDKNQKKDKIQLVGVSNTYINTHASSTVVGSPTSSYSFYTSTFYPPSQTRSWSYDTPRNEAESQKQVMERVLEPALAEIKQFRKESKESFDALKGTSQEIKDLQLQLAERTQTINELLVARKNAKRIYYVGLCTGISSSFAGVAFNNLIYIIVGLGVALTALTGLWEARQNEW